MNSVNLIGRWTADVQLGYSGAGKAYATARIAVSAGQDKANFFPVVMFERTAENVANNCGEKGRQVGITGYLQSRDYEKDGQRRSVVEVVATRVDFLDRKESAGGGNMGSEPNFHDDDDVPF